MFSLIHELKIVIAVDLVHKHCFLLQSKCFLYTVYTV